jgi:hypothetical protein
MVVQIHTAKKKLKKEKFRYGVLVLATTAQTLPR